MHSIKCGLFFAVPLATALTLGVAPEPSHAAGLCQKIRGVANKGCVKTKDLNKGTVRAKHLKTRAVTANKLTAGALAGGREPVEACGVIDQPGSYVLVNDLPGPLGLNPDGGCLVIEADDVTLDLAGFSIVGDRTGDPDRGDGVRIHNRSNVTIDNGTIRNFVGDGISALDKQFTAQNHRIGGIRAIGNGENGIDLNGLFHQVTNCLAKGNVKAGIFAGDGALVMGNTTDGNDGDGIRAGITSSVTGNIAVGNDGFGIDTGNLSVLAGNFASGNAGGNIDSCTECQAAANLPAVVVVP